MPHLPIEIIGGSVSINLPVSEGGRPRIEARGAIAPIPATEDHEEVMRSGYSEADPRAQIYLIEVKRAEGTEIYNFAPAEDGVCKITIHYLNGEEVERGVRPELPEGTTILRARAVAG